MSDELDTGVCFGSTLGSCVSRAVVHDEDPIDEVRDRTDRGSYKRLFVMPARQRRRSSLVHRARL